MYTDDPIADFHAYDRKQQEWLDRLPKCAHCGQPIQDDDYYEIEEVNVCSDCIYDYCDEHYKKTNNDL